MGRPQKDNDDRDRLASDWLSDPTQFQGATFKAFIDPTKLAFGKTGNLSVTFTIPAGQVNDALPLRYLIRDRLPLLIVVDVDPVFQVLKEQQQAHLALLPSNPDEPDEFEGD